VVVAAAVAVVAVVAMLSVAMVVVVAMVAVVSAAAGSVVAEASLVDGSSDVWPQPVTPAQLVIIPLQRQARRQDVISRRFTGPAYRPPACGYTGGDRHA
jgi:hypothetical protein